MARYYFKLNINDQGIQAASNHDYKHMYCYKLLKVKIYPAPYKVHASIPLIHIDLNATVEFLKRY